jgi:hypothetical protein
VGWFLFLLAVTFAAWIVYDRLFPDRHAPRTFTARTEGNIRGDGSFDFEVVGESHYQANLERIAGPRKKDGKQLLTTATLLLDDDNPHDKNAVKVYIDSLPVGHLPRDVARTWRARLRKSGGPVGNYTCAAMIVGGWKKGRDDEGSYGVRLDIPEEED